MVIRRRKTLNLKQQYSIKKITLCCILPVVERLGKYINTKMGPLNKFTMSHNTANCNILNMINIFLSNVSINLRVLIIL